MLTPEEIANTDVIDPAAQAPQGDPPPELVDALVQHYKRKQQELTQQIADMESFIGFIEVSGNLAVRVAKLEQFLGIKA
jgi:hypothetical protein